MRIGIAGLGAVGLDVARRLIDGDVPGLTLTAVAVRDADKARRVLPQIGDAIALRTLATIAAPRSCRNRRRRTAADPWAWAIPCRL
jgi:aspartate dehydrogenase